MSRDHSQNHYGPNASFDGHDSDLAAALAADQLSEAYEAGKRDASADLGQDAFEKWLYDKCPSGGVESVQRQWLESYEHAEFAGKMEQAAQIESLRQQLAAAQLEREAMKIERDKAYEIAALANHRLAAALAACKQKDEALAWIKDNVTYSKPLSLYVSNALTIQPDDSALKAWLEMSNTADCRSQSSLQGVVK